MPVRSFMKFCKNPDLVNITLYDKYEGSDIWSGWGDEIPKEYLSYKIVAFDCPNGSLMLEIDRSI